MDSEDTVSPWLSHAAPTHSRRSIHACPHAPALRFDYPPPTIRFLARPPCPSCSVPSIASLCSALSRTTRDHSKAKGPDGDSLVICRCVQGTLFCSPSPCRMSNASKRLTRIIHEGFYCNRRYVAATSLTAGGLPLGRSTYCWGLAPFFLAPVPVPKRRHRHRQRSQSPGLRAPVSHPLPHPPPYYGGGMRGGPTNRHE